jgi:hypothetical protein
MSVIKLVVTDGVFVQAWPFDTIQPEQLSTKDNAVDDKLQ